MGSSGAMGISSALICMIVASVYQFVAMLERPDCASHCGYNRILWLDFGEHIVDMGE